MKLIILLRVGIYLRVIYSLYLFSYVNHGNFRNLIIKINSNKIAEFLNLILH